MKEMLMGAIINGVGLILIGLITYFANYITVRLGDFIEDKEIGEEIENKKYLAEIVVNAIQQIYEEEDGPVKYEKAKNEFVKMAVKNGVNIDIDELEMFIEDAYKAMKDGIESGKNEIESKPRIRIVKGDDK